MQNLDTLGSYFEKHQKLPELYDHTTFKGRYQAMRDTCSPSALFHSSRVVEDARQTVDNVSTKTGDWKGMSVSEYKEALRIKSAVFHPDTGEPIFAAFRFSSFMPANIFIVLGMLHPSQHTPSLVLFWQWFNQTYNVCVNYANRNASAKVDTKQVAASYFGACATACSLGLYGNYLAKRSKNPVIGVLTPFLAVAMAGVANVSIMRQSDFRVGVSLVNDETGEDLCDGEPSLLAGKHGLSQVAITRITTPGVLMLLPPIGLFLLHRITFFRRYAHKLDTALQILFISAALNWGVPACLAAYPLTCVMPIESVESRYKSCITKNGNPVQFVSFNKGL